MCYGPVGFQGTIPCPSSDGEEITFRREEIPDFRPFFTNVATWHAVWNCLKVAVFGRSLRKGTSLSDWRRPPKAWFNLRLFIPPLIYEDVFGDKVLSSIKMTMNFNDHIAICHSQRLAWLRLKQEGFFPFLRVGAQPL